MHKVQKYLINLLTDIFQDIPTDYHITLQTPPKKQLGDMCFGLFDLMKRYKSPPHEIGEKILSHFNNIGDTSIIESLTLTGPYINIKLQKKYYAGVFAKYFLEKNYYGNKQDTSQKTIIVDYIGVNMGKPMHIGHICTPLQGQTCINLLRKLGHHVIGDTHICDWGIIMGKLIIAYKRYGDEKQLQENAVEHLFNLYVKISGDTQEDPHLEQDFRDAFQLLSSGDKSSIELWKKFTNFSIEDSNMLLSRMFVKPDYNIGESFYEGINLPKLEDNPDLSYNMKDIVQELIQKGIATKNEDNSVGVVFSESSKLPSCILQKRNGTHGYLASDLACVKYRIENWNPSCILYFTDVRQQLHFKQVFEISKQAGWLSQGTELVHIYNGFISLKDGAMSTRKGRIIKLAALFDEAHDRAKKIILEKRNIIEEDVLSHLAEQVGIGAIMYGYLKKSRELDVVFDWDEFMSFEGNSGPYIQYAYVRARKILLNGDKDIRNIVSQDDIVFSKDAEVQLAQKLLDFPQVISDIQHTYHFHTLCLYVYELTKIFNVLYVEAPILTENNIQVKNSRLALLLCFTDIIEESFSILGIQLPIEM